MSQLELAHRSVARRQQARRRTRQLVLGAAVLAGLLVAAGCSATPTVEATGNTTTVQIHMVDGRYVPDSIEVPIGDRLLIDLINDDTDLHDLELSNGTTSSRFGSGSSETVDVGVISADLDGWCTIPPHRAEGMVMKVTAID